MVRVHIWVRRKDGMAADGYQHLKGYVVTLVTRVPDGQTSAYDGVAELTWDDRDGFKADMQSEAGKRATDDLANFAAAFGLLFVEHAAVK